MSVKNNMSAIGYLGKDGEVRYAASGTAILSFSLPVESGWGDNKKTTWLNCVAFGKKAEGKLVEYLVKGQQVAVQGEINLNKYTGSDGLEKSSLELIVNDVALVGKAPQSSGAPASNNQPSGAPNANQTPQSDDGGFIDDRIPFSPIRNVNLI